MKITDTFLNMLKVQSLARNIDHNITCLTAIPGYEDNKSIIASYEDGLFAAIDDLQKLLAEIEAEVKP